MTHSDGDELIAFGEKLLAILDRGTFTATYKYAVLLALMDLALEATGRDGAPPTSVTTRQLAERIIDLYWPHTRVFSRGSQANVLWQNRPQKDKHGQAEIVTALVKFREATDTTGTTTLHRRRLANPKAWQRLVNKVEWVLVEMPLPRLQIVGRLHVPFLYAIGWDTDVRKRDLKAESWDNSIRFIGRAAEYLVRLAGLVRPIIQREWARTVAQFNDLPESTLDAFLFGRARDALTPVRPGLFDLQEGRCFYCRKPAKLPEMQVDHFIPWARHPNDAVENLVVAHAGCNSSKSDHLAATAHVSSWRERNEGRRTDLDELARGASWESEAESVLGVARGVYLRLPDGSPLWRSRSLFEPAARDELTGVLATA